MVRRTKYQELGYEQVCGDWRFVDLATGNHVGPSHPSERSLLADLDREASLYGHATAPARESMVDAAAVRAGLTRICDLFERSAPTVHEWANDLFIRFNEYPDTVTASELFLAADLASGEVGPNVAANQVYKLMCRLKRVTTGHAGF